MRRGRGGVNDIYEIARRAAARKALESRPGRAGGGHVKGILKFLAALAAGIGLLLAIHWASGCGDPCDSRPAYEHPQPEPKQEPWVDTGREKQIANIPPTVDGDRRAVAAAPARESHTGAGNVTALAGSPVQHDVLDAIRQVESSGRANPPDGDGGCAIGPYQIHREYWLDARMPFGTYQDCRREGYARQVVTAYLARYVSGGGAEWMARVHNGGPLGHAKNATVGYWRKVRAAMNTRRATDAAAAR